MAVLRVSGMVQGIAVAGAGLSAATGGPHGVSMTVAGFVLALEVLRFVARRGPPDRFAWTPPVRPDPQDDPFAWKPPRPDPTKVPARVAAATAREKGFVALVTIAPGVYGGGWLFLRRLGDRTDTERLPLDFDEVSHEFVVSVVEFYAALNRLLARGEFNR